jgi:hypothetical protein
MAIEHNQPINRSSELVWDEIVRMRSSGHHSEVCDDTLHVKSSGIPTQHNEACHGKLINVSAGPKYHRSSLARAYNI